MITYTPLDWYWLADDGRVYTSARNAVVDKTDAGFVAREAMDGFTVTRWPVDEAGAQTVASMQEVMALCGVTVPGVPRKALGYDLLGALTEDERAVVLTSAVKIWDRLMIQSRPTPFPETNLKIKRFADALKTTPKALFDRVHGVAS